ncbi:ABC transporter substrate-binding protein [Aquisalimonas sp. 2447]|uniref:ABC transporter substrate-binding protein n=1 Tax=Aquisalimonas sp. 2447 TaxID=2740807 RepID=UPI0020C5A213|nr:ABC transporter substrate-binding protein [Aquisalimonas sp. 2447]
MHTTTQTHGTFRGSAGGVLAAVMAAALTFTAGAVNADHASEMRFGVPTWPGVTVKSEVAAQLLQHMGYDTDQMNASPAVILNSLADDDLDIYMGGWMPTQREMLDPLEESGDVRVLTENIADAVMGIAVPEYVRDAGVRTEEDLAEYADEFDRTIHGIEAGSGFNDSIQEAIDSDRHGLGGWQLLPSSTSAMLAEVQRAVDREEWIIFLGWEPHWMNVVLDFHYIEAVGDREIAETTSDVLTVGNPVMLDAHPHVERFLTQYRVPKDEQSAWILEFDREDREADEVAHEWIGNNLDLVAEWLDGVETRDGDAAIDAVRAAY